MKRSVPQLPIRHMGVVVALTVVGLAILGFSWTSAQAAPPQAVEVQQDRDLQDQIAEGRELVITHACGACHGGGENPAAEGWLAGIRSPAEEIPIGPCGAGGDDTCYIVRPRNLTPHPTTGMGRFSERQIFNALRYGLRPGETADVEITSSTPGEGNFPMFPKYLAPPMPWTAWRHMTDDQLLAIAAYLKHGLKPVDNFVEVSDGPPDFWASEWTEEKYGTYPLGEYPGPNEVAVGPGVDLDRVLRGRHQVVERGCGDCHGGYTNPDAPGFMAGMMNPSQAFPVGPCFENPDLPCWMLRPRNLTPHPTDGIGRWTDQQIFNALKHGLAPRTGPDAPVALGEHPEGTELLGPAMPWMVFRHMADEELYDMIYYLRNGLKAVANSVPESDRPEEGWAALYAEIGMGEYPVVAFPTRNEVGG